MLDHVRFDAILVEAGRIALGQWPGMGHAPATWHKDDKSPVCAADLAVDAYLRRELGSLLPAAGWLSEETVDVSDRTEDSLIWLVDPIDGTRDFIRGRTGWAISVALISAGRPLLAGLFAPARDEYWRAQAGKGAYRNDRPLRASQRAELPGARTPADVLPSADIDLTCVERPNSIALRMAMVAADEADLVASLRLGFEWDIGAAGLIAREAGAEVTDAFGAPIAFNKRDPRAHGILVSAPGIHAAAVERISERARRMSA
ncbi:3'(2'),5'-bisphosphate nucleotidase CysQ [Croceicoccus naphthovorans]|uniref:Inositol monophosphatase n=1 Tax=Croceicoccus naphthovorans TaxID=1348774 RepID=A0A0G3XE63_9SPHN|nr:3'(2'),5'-bisphosphate nucleotidase CysQ [Croceicoccus naphthovorans]AKM08931.1 inositol monophosphatase [Croceicoccus naphthovorans]MBB3989282.1 myo-inositol-1(or 4)-monophosphatase [Croceicoccus naphthovorans]